MDLNIELGSLSISLSFWSDLLLALCLDLTMLRKDLMFIPNSWYQSPYCGPRGDEAGLKFEVVHISLVIFNIIIVVYSPKTSCQPTEFLSHPRRLYLSFLLLSTDGWCLGLVIPVDGCARGLKPMWSPKWLVAQMTLGMVFHDAPHLRMVGVYGSWFPWIVAIYSQWKGKLLESVSALF